MSQVAGRIVGELMQPGGVRALERMGLGAAAKGAETDCVQVDGCVPTAGAGGGGGTPRTAL